MAALVEQMAYRAEGGEPWHGLGKPVNNNMTTDEMLEAAGLNWTVSKREMYFRKVAKNSMRIVPNEYALVRDSDESVLDTVGENFKIPQNRDILDFFKRFVEAGDMQMETAGSLKDGKFIWALARINAGFNLGKGDITNGYLLLSQPHQFGYSLTACLTPVRVVCWNTINAASGIHKGDDSRVLGSHFRMVHSTEFDSKVKSEIETTLGLAHDNMKAFGHTAELLSQSSAKDETVTEYFHRIMELDAPEEGLPEDNEIKENRTVKRFREALTHAPGQELFKGTWWNAFNGVTYTVDHELGRTVDNRLHSAWYGKGASTKRRALELAVEYAKG